MVRGLQALALLPLAATLLLGSGAARLANSTVPPVVLIPGLTGSNLWAKLTDADTYPWCPRDTYGQWQQVWPIGNMPVRHDSPENGVGGPTPQQELKCLERIFEVHLDNGTFANTRGVEIEARGFGAVGASIYSQTIYNASAEYGWVVNKSFVTATYDWRLVPNTTYFEAVRTLIENVSATNGNRKVVLLAHSLGPQVALAFLHAMDQAWKDKYILLFSAFNPVWSGSTNTVLELVAGGQTKRGISPNIIGAALQNITSHIPTSYWILPMPGAGAADGTWGPDDILVKTSRRSYAAKDFPELFVDLGFDPEFYALVANTTLGPTEFKPPMVDTRVAYGEGLPTIGTLVWFFEHFEPNVYPKAPTRVEDLPETGDDTVPLRSSLRAKYAWTDAMKAANKTFLYKGYDKLAHDQCIFTRSPCFVDFVAYVKTL